MTRPIMTDSAAYLPENLLKKHQIHTVPTVIRFGEEIYYENVDLTIDQFYEKFFSLDVYPQTANPTLAHQYELFKKLGENGDEILNIVISSGISGSYNTAINARKMYEKKVTDAPKVHIFDSKIATFGIGIIALKAAEMVKKGISTEKILQELEKFRDSLEVGFTVAHLKYLHRGGRLSRSKFWIAQIADMIPVINFTDGKMDVVKTVRGHENAVIESFNTVYEKKGKPDKFNAYIMHARNEDSANLLREHIETKIQPKEYNIAIRDLGMTIVTHTGPGCIGICLDTEYKFFDINK